MGLYFSHSIKKNVLSASFLILFLFVHITHAQSVDSRTMVNSTSLNVRRNVAIVLFSGLGGTLLGISTLSFYGQPQEHVENINWGFGLGILVGAIYTLNQSSFPASYNQSSSFSNSNATTGFGSKDFYNQGGYSSRVLLDPSQKKEFTLVTKGQPSIIFPIYYKIF